MRRTFVMGDPQAPFVKTLEVLALHGALAGDRLAPDVVLVSIGDHFDYDLNDPITAGQEGLRTLRWLASHDPVQVVLLLGNHDASRVMELAAISDADFSAARDLAQMIASSHRAGMEIYHHQLNHYEVTYPLLPPPGVIGRDYASFSTEQRKLVQDLLLAGRFHLARTGTLPDGRPVLLTHAGVTRRELGLLGVDNASPATVASALDAYLAAAVERVRDAWQRGDQVALSLEPLHLQGAPGEEGGGLLYHRPSNPDRPGANHNSAWSLAPGRPRRFDPRTLPRGLTQVAGHSGHAKCVEELGEWVRPAARARKHGGIRTLRFGADGVTYDLGVAPPAEDVADLILIDGELRRVGSDEVALLTLAGVDAP